MPERVGVITTYRLNAHDMFKSPRFVSVAKTCYDAAVAAHDENPSATPPELAGILGTRRPPEWHILARSPQLWNSIVRGVFCPSGAVPPGAGPSQFFGPRAPGPAPRRSSRWYNTTYQGDDWR
jgi:hypothetical protein